MNLFQLAKKIGGEYRGEIVPFCGASMDTRTLKPGELFVAIKGKNTDGHEFVKQAAQLGAAAVMVERPMNELSIPQLIVPCSTRALGLMAQYWREQFSIPVIALTGSCGKTGTKEMIAEILRECGETLVSEGNYNNQYGLPLTLLKLNHSHRFLVLEMGTNSPGEILYLTQIAKPTVALITNIHASHLEGLKSFEGVSDEKSEIFKGLPPSGVVVINLDEPFSSTWQHKISVSKRVTFSRNQAADVRGSDEFFHKEGVSFKLHTPLGEVQLDVPLLGEHVVNNAIAAAACALAVGADLLQVKTGLEKSKPVKGRFKPFRLENNILLIDDTYNASVKSVENAIDSLAKHKGKKIFVMSNMGELGDFALKFHRKMGEQLREQGIDVVLLTGQLDFLGVTMEVCPKARYFEDKPGLLAALKNELEKDCMILVKGSRSQAMEQVVESLLGKAKC